MLSYIKKLDAGLVLPFLVVATASLVVIASLDLQLFYQQLAWYAIGIATALLFALLDLRPFFQHRSVALAIYIFAVGLLVLTLFVAPVIRGTRSWIPLGPLQFQTSELAKIALILLLSFYFAKRHIGIAHKSTIFLALFYAAIPIGLVLAQPDMGTALVLSGLFIGYLFVSGLRPRHILIGLACAVVGLVWAWGGFLKDYQKERVLGLIYPERDPLGYNYSTIQSKIALGSGGFWGKGFGQGTQVQLGFLPEPQTDFIFSALVEEWGFFGGFMVLAAFLALLLRIGWIGYLARDNFSKFVCLGTMIVFLIHFIFNVGSVMGLLPVIGVSFPLLSYGGSNLLVSCMLMGLVASIGVRSYF